MIFCLIIYYFLQYGDIKNGTDPNLRTKSVNNNECGIVILGATTAYGGLWRCRVSTFKQNLTASMNLIIGK